eukprot:Hpha_TRINITY_DN24795_c0_g1::TRINITY_DN24795_c0_g1_i1::g.110278::m.110278/K12846/SNRNP27; U4/U6.U5 tri-snRNP-associated protein 3
MPSHYQRDSRPPTTPRTVDRHDEVRDWNPCEVREERRGRDRREADNEGKAKKRDRSYDKDDTSGRDRSRDRRRGKKEKKGKAEEEEPDPDQEADALARIMGISSFGTTQGKQVVGNEEGFASRKNPKLGHRQYMNKKVGYRGAVAGPDLG